jgi:hypothetical protein
MHRTGGYGFTGMCHHDEIRRLDEGPLSMAREYIEYRILIASPLTPRQTMRTARSDKKSTGAHCATVLFLGSVPAAAVSPASLTRRFASCPGIP